MGICVHKGQVPPGARSKSELRGTREPTQRQRLSVLSVTNEESKHVLEVYSKQTRGFTRTITAKEGKEEQGTVVLFGHRLVIQGCHEAGVQDGFEDKKMSVTGDTIGEEVLARAGLAFICKKGLKPESPNQDDFCVVLEGASILLGVFDGHGPFGHEVSNFVHALLPKLITTNPAFESAPAETVRAAFLKAHEHLLSNCEHPEASFNCSISGTTASLAVFRGKKLLVAHVGDSRVVMAKRRNDALVAVPITIDHKPTLTAEKERIEASGGQVKRMPYDIPYRVFMKDKEYPGLSMSRAIGDSMAHSIGVISEPEVCELDLSAEDEFLILCSDGVWEFVKDEEAVELVGKYVQTQAKQAAEKLAQLAWTRWLKNEDEVVDDITVIVAYIPKLIV